MVHDPLSPSEALRTRLGAALAAVSLFVFVYGVVVVAQLLLAVLIAGFLTVGVYLWYRTFAVLDSIADAVQRIADATEHEAHETADRDASGPVRSTRLTDREE
ncbi:hypothetical protein DQW50_11985 [Halorubrum sp. 48-1-W]|uniref:hypothetical protein n=1 Tax=Halorubrum sp. 48-1-W TaxID=2249761 RepID=UPI000DCE1D9C|nr:hypothetical protein [Halorubrum sp. 48-1-W]RAW44879.1 hypothetical protein DQW50_11985 [Halorubrum sp. 48-1-W]